MSTPPGPSAVSRDRHVSTDPAEAERFLSRTYTDLSLHLAHKRGTFRLEHDAVTAGPVTFGRLTTTVAFEARAAASERVVVNDVRDGGLTWTSQRYGTVRAGAGDVGLAPPGSAHRADVEAGEIDIVVLDPARLDAYATGIHGLSGRPRFTALAPGSTDLAAHWRATALHVRDDVLANTVASTSPMVIENAFRLLASTLLTAFPHTALGGAHSRSVRLGGRP